MTTPIIIGQGCTGRFWDLANTWDLTFLLHFTLYFFLVADVDHCDVRRSVESSRGCSSSRWNGSMEYPISIVWSIYRSGHTHLHWPHKTLEVWLEKMNSHFLKNISPESLVLHYNLFRQSIAEKRKKRHSTTQKHPYPPSFQSLIMSHSHSFTFIGGPVNRRKRR